MTTSDQQNQCLTAWTTYASSVDLGDATKRDLLNQEDAYWGGLSYSEFVHLWNDNQSRPPLSTNQSGDILQNGLLGAGAISIANPLPSPEDLLALFGLACLGVAVVFVAATTVTLSERQYYDFPQTEERGRDTPIPLPPILGRRWICDTKCQINGTNPRCTGTGYLSGIGYGNSQPAACAAAQMVINSLIGQILPNLGCYKRHCGCGAPGNRDCWQI